MQLAILYGPFQASFGVVPLGIGPWAIIFGGLATVFVLAILVSRAVVSRFGRP
jgi:hypothetical protein